MFVQTQKAQHPFALFCMNLFCPGSCTAKIEKEKQTAITLTDLAAMPKQSQLLLAHSLEQGNPYLTLLDNDRDVCKLLSAGWLISVPCPIIGIICVKVKPYVWRKLRSLYPQFLNNDLLSDLKTYRKGKSALYPWAW